MFTEADIPCTEHLDAVVIEELARHAVNALSGLWAGSGYYEDNRHVDHHGFDQVAPQATGVPAGLPSVGSDGEATAPVEPAEGSQEADLAPAFSLTTVCCLQTLVDAAALRPRWVPEETREQLVTVLLPCLLEMDPGQRDPVHPVDDGLGLLLLRHAALVTALYKTTSWRPRRDDLKEQTHEALQELKERVGARLAELGNALITRVQELQRADAQALHPYVVYVVAQALGQLSGEPESEAVADPAEATGALTRLWGMRREQLERLLARHSIGSVNANEAVAAALYAGVAAAVGPPARRHLDAALNAAVDDRFAFGGWRQGRVVIQEQRDALATVTLTVPTFEISRALGQLIARTLDDPDEAAERLPGTSRVIDDLAAAIRSAEASRVDDRAAPGWPGEQILPQDLSVEAWPTACVLGLCTAVSEVADAAHRRRLLRELSAFPAWGRDWPTYLKWDDYVRDNEPEASVAKILAFIDKEVVSPRVNRHPGASTDAIVVLLFGPPGTTKTTIARAVASGLHWPIVQLTPGNFIEGGMEKIEQRAEFYFSRLQDLYRTVVIMDECDELFRRRKPEEVSDAVRQVSAFMTASMLPKLQDLHDRSRIVLFVCTNFLTSIDPAIKRVGRVDYLIAVAPPDAAQRRHTIKLETKDREDPEQQRLLDRSVETLVRNTNRFIRGELVAAGRELRAVDTFRDEKHAVRVARDIAKRMKPAMTISPKDRDLRREFRKFETEGKAISQPHRNAKAQQES
jgi:hypothetical protein